MIYSALWNYGGSITGDLQEKLVRLPVRDSVRIPAGNMAKFPSNAMLYGSTNESLSYPVGTHPS